MFYKNGRLTGRFAVNGKPCTCGGEPISHMPKVARDKMSLEKILEFFFYMKLYFVTIDKLYLKRRNLQIVQLFLHEITYLFYGTVQPFKLLIKPFGTEMFYFF